MNPYGAFAIYKINECQFQGGRGGGGPTKPSGHTPNPLPAILNPRMIIIFIILMAFQYIQHVTYVYLAYKFGFLGNG